MVNPKFFFRGKLAREEAATAFLATLLECSREYRRRVLQHLELTSNEDSAISIETEVREIDLLMLLEDSIAIMAEVKVDAAAKTKGQLDRYYRDTVERFANRKIVCLYIAPTKGIARSELQSLDLRSNDKAAALTWTKLHALSADLPDIDAEFVEYGFVEVTNMIQSRKGIKYERIGDRDLVATIVENGRDQVMRTCTSDLCSIGVWLAQDLIQIETQKCRVTIHVQYRFAVDELNNVKLDRNGELIVLKLAALFKPTQKHKKDLAKWWLKITSGASWEGIGRPFRLLPNGWMEFIAEEIGTPEVLSTAMADLMLELIRAFDDVIALEPKSKTP